MGSLTRLLIAAHLLSIVICAKKSKAIQSLGFLTDSDISRVGGVYPCLFKTDVTGLILGATAGGTCRPGYRCTPGGRCVRVGGTGGPTGCSCERNKLIVEGGSPVPSMEACQLKCQQQSTCKVSVTLRDI